VLGGLTAWLLRMFAFLLRLLGNVGFYAGRFVVNVYDLIIFPALWLEGLLKGSKSKKIDVPEVDIPQDSSLVEESVAGFEETLKLKEQQE